MMLRPTARALAAAALVVAGLASSRASEVINVLTGGTSGIYYPLGVALAKIYADHLPGAQPAVQATKASIENLNLLQQGRGEVAFALGDALRLAWDGNEEAGFRTPLDRLRGIAAIHPNYIQIVAARDSGIRTLDDLRGKRLAVGAPKSGTELNARLILGAAGITYSDLARVEYLAFNESVELLKNRQIDATLLSAGLGVGAIRDLAGTLDVTLVEIPPDLVEAIGSPYVRGTIPAHTYVGQTEDVPAAAILNYLVTRETLSDDLVYRMTKAMFENLSELAASHFTGKSITLEGALEAMPIPIHPGAERYYRERGLVR